MPAEQRLRAGQQGEPGRSGQDPADGGEEDAIGRSPAGAAKLAFEHAELVTESENLGAEPGVRVVADDEDLEQETDDGVGEGARHEPGASQDRARGRAVASGCGPRADAAGLTGHRVHPGGSLP